MIWFRALIVLAVVGVLGAALWSTAGRPAPQAAAATPAAPPTPVPQPTALPTRVPLPTLAPEAITSLISRQTPAPPPAATLSAQPRVEVVDYGYSPQQITLHLGDSVTWTNDGNDAHDVTGDGPGGAWRSGPLQPAERYTRQFNLVGSYPYACTIHPEMHGQIVVQS